MPPVWMETDKTEPEQEAARLAALASTGILDSEPEASYDAITRLSAEYFQADAVLLGFADESRFWVKSYAGHSVRELPRQNSVFEMVLAEDGPVVIPDLSKHPQLQASLLILKRLEPAFLASAPVRSFENKILGALTIFRRNPHAGMEAQELAMLENLADMVASQLELRRLRQAFTVHSARGLHSFSAPAAQPRAGRGSRTCAGRSISASLFSTTSRKSNSLPAKSWVLRR